LKGEGLLRHVSAGTVIKNIRLTENEDEIDCRFDKVKGLFWRVRMCEKS